MLLLVLDLQVAFYFRAHWYSEWDLNQAFCCEPAHQGCLKLRLVAKKLYFLFF